MSKKETVLVRKQHHDPRDPFPQIESARKPSECRAFLGVVHERLAGLPDLTPVVVRVTASAEVLPEDGHGAHDALASGEARESRRALRWSSWPGGRT